MRTTFTLIYLLTALFAQAQEPIRVTEGIITTNTRFTAREENMEEMGNGNFLNFDMRKNVEVGYYDRLNITSITYFKDDMAATLIERNGRINTNIRNYKAGITYHFIKDDRFPSYGITNVVYFADTAVQRDIAEENTNWYANQKDSFEMPQVKVYYQDADKTIAGYPCKKAIVYLLYSNGSMNKIDVWYNEAITIKNIASTGDPNFLSSHRYIGMPNNQFNLLGAVKGFPMEYEMKLYKKIYITVSVTELNLKKRVREKFFKFPYDHRLLDYKKPYQPIYREVQEFRPIVSDPSVYDF